MKLIQKIIGVCLTLIASVVAYVFVLADRISDWRERRRSVVNQSRIKAEIRKLNQLATMQRDIALRSKAMSTDDAKKARIPVIVVIARVLLLIIACCVGGVIASQCSRPKCHWKAYHANTLTENINGEWVCDDQKRKTP